MGVSKSFIAAVLTGDGGRGSVRLGDCLGEGERRALLLPFEVPFVVPFVVPFSLAALTAMPSSSLAMSGRGRFLSGEWAVLDWCSDMNQVRASGCVREANRTRKESENFISVRLISVVLRSKLLDK